MMAMEECPSLSETILGLTFIESRCVAQVCLVSWNRRSIGNPAFFRGGLKAPWARLPISSRVPTL
jgi:hypothetical protein